MQRASSSQQQVLAKRCPGQRHTHSRQPSHHSRPSILGFSCELRPRPTAARAAPLPSTQGGGSNNGASGFGHAGEPGPSGNPPSSSWWIILLKALAAYLAALLGCGAAVDAWYAWTLPKLATADATVSIIIPALNEEAAIAETVRRAKALQPAPLEVIVVDSSSSDRTVAEARRSGAKVVRGAPRGRSRQMNAGAAAARGDLLCFLHADTHLDQHAVAVLREQFSDPRTVLTGFRPHIQGSRGALWLTTAHHYLKTWYGPLLFRPGAYVRGARLLFGDQALACRAEDFKAAGCFQEDIPIMEDASLCVKLHEQGPGRGRTGGAAGARYQYQGPGRVRMLLRSTAVTSGRRIEAWGELRATGIFVLIGLRWFFGAPPQELHRLYRTLYTDAYR